MHGQVFYMSMDEGATLVDLPEESSTHLGKDTNAAVQNRMHQYLLSCSQIFTAFFKR
jgi:hypothetical protein